LVTGQKHDIGGLDVAVHDPGGVRNRKAIRDLHSVGQHALDRQTGVFAGQDGFQVFTFQQFHDQERLAVMLTSVEDGRNGRVA
jgi:hypothetical protein